MYPTFVELATTHKGGVAMIGLDHIAAIIPLEDVSGEPRTLIRFAGSTVVATEPYFTVVDRIQEALDASTHVDPQGRIVRPGEERESKHGD